MHARVISVWRIWCSRVYSLSSDLKLWRLPAITQVHCTDCACAPDLPACKACAPSCPCVCVQSCCILQVRLCIVCKGTCAAPEHVAAAVSVKPSNCDEHSVHEVTSSQLVWRNLQPIVIQHMLGWQQTYCNAAHQLCLAQTLHAAATLCIRVGESTGRCPSQVIGCCAVPGGSCD
jgi:hypothetical protein